MCPHRLNELSRWAARPFAGEDLVLANEAWSTIRAWIYAALLSSGTALTSLTGQVLEPGTGMQPLPPQCLSVRIHNAATNI